jgi:hypothetical protein
VRSHSLIDKEEKVLVLILKGIKGLVESKKGVLILLILTISSVLCAKGRIDGTAYAAVMTVISTIYCWTSSKIDVASMQSCIPPRAQK